MIVSIPAPSNALTINERRVFELKRKGYSDEEISHKLRMSLGRNGFKPANVYTQTVFEAVSEIRRKGYKIQPATVCETVTG